MKFKKYKNWSRIITYFLGVLIAVVKVLTASEFVFISALLVFQILFICSVNYLNKKTLIKNIDTIKSENKPNRMILVFIVFLLMLVINMYPELTLIENILFWFTIFVAFYSYFKILNNYQGDNILFLYIPFSFEVPIFFILLFGIIVIDRLLLVFNYWD